MVNNEHDCLVSMSTLGLSSRRRTPRARRCNLCKDEFRPRTLFDRFCRDCRACNELLRFSEWLPELDADLVDEKVTA